jgi:hypothetical protein
MRRGGVASQAPIFTPHPCLLTKYEFRIIIDEN